METMEQNNITKREFLRQCAFCAGGLALGVYKPNWFSPPSGNDLGKWSKEALFYKKTADGLQCEKCPHGCLLNEGETWNLPQPRCLQWQNLFHRIWESMCCAR